MTCMDARIDPAKALGLDEGDAHVIRNAGGLVTDDVLRSLAISHWLLGTEKVYVIGHTECGMAAHTPAEMRARIGPAAEAVEFGFFGSLEESIRQSVRRVRESRLLPASFRAVGWVYDVKTGAISEVPD